MKRALRGPLSAVLAVAIPVVATASALAAGNTLPALNDAGAQADLTNGAGQAQTSTNTGTTASPVPPTPVVPSRTYTETLNVPSRYQWFQNYGYCGETSMQAAALYYGIYASQYKIRSLASPGVPQNSANSQLFPGEVSPSGDYVENAVTAARALQLTAVDWDPSTSKPTSSQFLDWVKHEVVEGNPTIIGVFENEYWYGSSPSGGDNEGDSDFDHVVLVNEVGSSHPLNKTGYYANDIFAFSDNGLDNPMSWSPGNQSPTPPHYSFWGAFGSDQLNRRAANKKKSPLYSVKLGGRNFGTAITGIDDPTGETLPVSMTTKPNYEWPSMPSGGTAEPAPESIVLSATARDLTPGSDYNYYVYTSLSSIPTSKFNANASQASSSGNFTASSTTYKLPLQTILSNTVLAYRVVPLSGA